MKIVFALLSLNNISTGMDTQLPSATTQLALTAIELDSPDFLKAALSLGADIDYVDSCNNNLLLSATKSKKEKTALYLCTQPHFQDSSIINQQNSLGETVLIWACEHGNKEIVQKLFTIKNIDLDIQSKDGRSALHYAFNNKKEDILLSLINQGASLSLQDNMGITPAFFSFSGHPKKNFLIEKFVHATDRQGNTQLHLLTTSLIGKITKKYRVTLSDGFSGILKGLIQHNINIWCTNNHGLLPLETAYEKYDQLYQQYQINKLSCLQKLLNNQEEMLHLFLLHYLENIQNKPIIISSTYASELNIETVIAQKYKNNQDYYKNYAISFKDKLKAELRHNRINVPIIWVSKEPIYSYIAPEILENIINYFQTQNKS
jgi:hypothetical protein